MASGALLPSTRGGRGPSTAAEHPLAQGEPLVPVQGRPQDVWRNEAIVEPLAGKKPPDRCLDLYGSPNCPVPLLLQHTTASRRTLLDQDRHE